MLSFLKNKLIHIFLKIKGGKIGKNVFFEKNVFFMLIIFLTLILTEISAYKRNKQKNSDFPWFV